MRSLFRVLLALGILGFITACAVFMGAYTYYAKELPTLDRFEKLLKPGVTRFESADGQLVGEWFHERRILVDWGELPRELALAFLAAEDARFFEHAGLDFRGILRAMVANLRSGSIQQGASTITQQLAKTLVGRERTYGRKMKEAILARRIEALYSKEEILTWYVNAIYLGHGSYGVQAAAQNYFRKDIWNLNIAETAMLAGLAQAPSRVNPAVNMPMAEKRMLHVLAQMHRRGWIDEAEFRAAQNNKLRIYPIRDAFGDHVPYFTAHVRTQIKKEYDDGAGNGSWLDLGLRVSTHVEPSHQMVAAQALRTGLEDLARRQGYPGPLGQLDRDKFFERNARWVSSNKPKKGTRLLGRVAEVTRKSAQVELSPTLSGSLSLDTVRWAGPYTEFPKNKRGKARRDGKVSFKPRLKDMKRAFQKGDIILVEITDFGPNDLLFNLVPIPMMDGSLLSYGAHMGQVDTMVGGWDFDRSQVNRAFSLRQTGSAIKPIVYARAYDLGLPPSALFSGAPFREGGYNPTGDRTKNDMMVWDALAKSENAVSLRVLKYVLNHSSKESFRDWGRQLGLSRDLKGHTSEVLGADQTPFSMARAFGAFCREGFSPDMGLVRKVTDRSGNILQHHIHPLDPHSTLGDRILAIWAHAQTPHERAITQDTAYLMASNLAEVVERGTGRKARSLKRSVGGKTGTLAYDVWFSGFSRDRVAVAWVGADKRERPLGLSVKNNKVYGSDTALPIWTQFMAEIDSDRANRLLTDAMPDSVHWLRIDPDTGLLARTDGRTIPHRKGTEPQEFATPPEAPEHIHTLEGNF